MSDLRFKVPLYNRKTGKLGARTEKIIVISQAMEFKKVGGCGFLFFFSSTLKAV